MAGSPAETLAQRLGIRTGRFVAPAGLIAVFAGAALFLFPPHNAVEAIALGIGGVATFGLGMVRYAGGPWWALISAAVSGLFLFVALIVAGRGLLLRVLGESELCEVVQRQQVDTEARYKHIGFVHTLDCPRAGRLAIRTDSTDRQETGARVEVLTDPGGVLQPDFAIRHNVVGDALTPLAATGLAVATVWFTRKRGATRAS
ncbi:hypothetical protein [Amycolatopsis taiwanensis]|uniref:hypothetical protein n=1 Tax=Amycolatopsis taiwanensis TaxID=342230 RepID=UPI0012EC5EAB|nr:hypothetical protein [Amycolatopsis taiwanensis]